MRALKRSVIVFVGLCLIGTGAYWIRALREAPKHAANGPLTDVAARGQTPVLMYGSPAEAPAPPAPPSAGAGATPAAEPVKPVAPSLMPDPAHPPQWTTALATPPPPKPPDPFLAPPTEVDPSPGHHTNAE